MAAETIKDFLIGIGYEVDEAGAQQANEAVTSLDDAVRALGEVLVQGADWLKSFFSDAAKGSEKMSKSTESMEAAASAAASLAGGQQEAAKAAQGMADSQAAVGDAVQSQADAMQQGADAAVELGAGEKEATAAAGELTSATHGVGDAASKAGQKVQKLGKTVDEAGNNAKKAADGFKQANNAAKMQNAKQGTLNLKQMNNELKKGVNLIKKFVGMAATLMIGGSIKSAIGDVLKLNEGLVEDAKTLKKSIEETRAYNTALAVMGKTADEIEKNEALKKTFNSLQAIGAQMALPQAAQGVHAIQDVKDALMQLKFTGTYVLQWLVYRIQTVADGPLSQIRNMVGDLRDKLINNVEKIANAVAKGVGWAIQLLASAGKAIGSVIEWINKLPPAIRIVGAVALAVIAAIHSKAFLITLIVGAILLLIDDLVTYLEGGDALFANFWKWGVSAFNRIKKVVNETVDAIKQFYAESTDEEGHTNWFLFGKKLAGKLYEGAKEVLEGFGKDIKKWIVGDEDATWPEVAEAIRNGIKAKADLITGDIKEAVTGERDATWPEVANAIIKGLIDKASDILKWVKKAITGDENASLPEVATAIIKGITDEANNILGAVKKAITGDENASIADVALAIIAGIREQAGNILAAVKEAITGTENPSWTEVAVAIKNGLVAQKSVILAAVKEAISGDENAGWDQIGKDIWAKIKAGIKETGDWLKVQLGYEPSDDWNTVGAAILDKIKAGIQVGTDFVTNILGKITEKISGYNFDGADAQAKLGSVADFATKLATNLLSKELGSISTISTFISNLVQAIGNNDAWNGVGATLGTVANKLLTAIGEALSMGSNTVGEVMVDVTNAAISLANGLLTALASAFDNIDGTSIGEAVGNVGKNIMTALGNIFTKDNIVKLGTSIETFCKSLMGAIADFFGGALQNGFATDLSNALNGILDALLGSISDLTQTEAYKGFVDNFGRAIGSIGSFIGEFVGNVLGDIINLIFTPEGLSKVWNAGVGLAQFLLDAIVAGIGGLINMIDNIRVSLLKKLGLWDEEAEQLKNAAVEANVKAGAEMTAAWKAAEDKTLEDYIGFGIRMAGLIRESADTGAVFWDGLLDSKAVSDFSDSVRMMIFNALPDEVTAEDVAGFGNSLTLMMGQLISGLANEGVDLPINIRAEDGSIDTDAMWDYIEKNLDFTPEKMEEMGIGQDFWQSVSTAMKNAQETGDWSDFNSLLEQFGGTITEELEQAMTEGVENADAEGARIAAEEKLKTAIDGVEATGEANVTMEAGEVDTSKLESETQAAAAEAVKDTEVSGSASANVEMSGAVNLKTDLSAEQGAAIGTDFMAAVNEALSSGLETMKGSYNDACEALGTSSERIRDKIKDVYDEVVASTGSFTSDVSSTLKSGMDEVKADFDSACQSMGTSSEQARDKIKAALAAVVANVSGMVRTVKAEFSTLASATSSTFATISSSIYSSMASAAGSVSSAVSQIKSSLNSIPKSVNVNVNTTKTETKMGIGGIVRGETQATIGEDGEEVVIPLEKHLDRARELLQYAIGKIGVDSSSYQSAVKMLGGNPESNITPVYGGSTSTSNQTTTNNNQIMAPATINVYGTDPQSTARNVAKNQEKLLVRNLRSILA